MTKKELIAALNDAIDDIRERNRWEYDTIRNASANGAMEALESFKLALEHPKKSTPDEE